MVMEKKKAFALRIDAALLLEVQRLAKEQYRSVNGQIEWMLMQSLREAKRWKDQSDNLNQGSEKGDERA